MRTIWAKVFNYLISRSSVQSNETIPITEKEMEYDRHLDFADGLVLLYHIQQLMEEKTSIVTEHSARLRMHIHWGNSKILKVNSTSAVSVAPRGEAIEEIKHFSWLGCVADVGWTEADVKPKNKPKVNEGEIKRLFRGQVV